MLNVAFKAGSSKQGKTLLASVGWNCVAAIVLEKEEKHKHLTGSD